MQADVRTPISMTRGAAERRKWVNKVARGWIEDRFRKPAYLASDEEWETAEEYAEDAWRRCYGGLMIPTWTTTT